MREAENSMNGSAPLPVSLQECMLDRKRRMIRKNVLLVLLAMPGILLDAVLISGIVWLLGPFENGVPWHRVFFWCIPITLLLFWWDDTQPESWTADDAKWAAGDPTLPGGPSLNSQGVPRGGGGYRGEFCTQLLTLLLLLGPRLLRGAAGKLWGIWKFRSANPERARQVLQQMAAVDYGVAVRSLLRPQEQLEVLLPTLSYLQFYGWIEVSEDTERVWFPADVRALMEKVSGRSLAEEGKRE